jgi:chromosome segregation ATPase
MSLATVLERLTPQPAPAAKQRDYAVEIAAVLAAVEALEAEASALMAGGGVGPSRDEAIAGLGDILDRAQRLRMDIPLLDEDGNEVPGHRTADNAVLDLIDTIEAQVERLQAEEGDGLTLHSRPEARRKDRTEDGMGLASALQRLTGKAPAGAQEAKADIDALLAEQQQIIEQIDAVDIELIDAESELSSANDTYADAQAELNNARAEIEKWEPALDRLKQKLDGLVVRWQELSDQLTAAGVDEQYQLTDVTFGSEYGSDQYV